MGSNADRDNQSAGFLNPASTAGPESAGRRTPNLAQVRAFHHIGVQTANLDVSVAWYAHFFDARVSWTLDKFSPLTLSRLPGITKLVEMVSEPLRFHLFARAGVSGDPPGLMQTQYQHLAIAVGSPAQLRAWHERWFDTARSGRYDFAGHEEPTGIVVDDDGVESFYCLDPNRLEFEFTYVPEAAP